MKMLTGKVVGGTVQILDEDLGALQEGAAVAILAADLEGHRLTQIQERELAEALARIRSGDFVDGRNLLREIQSAPAR